MPSVDWISVEREFGLELEVYTSDAPSVPHD